MAIPRRVVAGAAGGMRAFALLGAVAVSACGATEEEPSTRESVAAEIRTSFPMSRALFGGSSPGNLAAGDDGFRVRTGRAGAGLEVTVSPVADGAWTVRTPGGRRARVRRVGATPARVEVVDGGIETRGVRPGVDSVTFARGRIVEELLLMRESVEYVEYAIDVPLGSRLHRAAPGVVEVRDRRDSAWLRLTARQAWDREGHPVGVTLDVNGPIVRVSVDADAATPVLVDPAWELTDSPAFAGRWSTAALLPSGRVLLAGGWRVADTVATAEEFDPLGNAGRGAFAVVGTLTEPRALASGATLRDGRVLLVGGLSSSTAEVFDSTTGAFRPTGSMQGVSDGGTLSVLDSGEVLVVGGSRAALFDPAAGGGDGEFRATGPPTTMRTGHAATVLADGRVLITGGNGVGVDHAELFDPAADSGRGAFTGIGPLGFMSPVEHTATRMPDGRVIVAGGRMGLTSTASVEAFDPSSNGGLGGFTPLASMLNEARENHAAVLLTTGELMLAGGRDQPISGSASSLRTTELYDGTSGPGAFVPGAPLPDAMFDHTATMLPNGNVLVVGEVSTSLGNESVATTLNVRVEDGLGSFSPAGTLRSPRSGHVAALLPSGDVLVAGGVDATGAVVASAERFDPASGASVPAGAMTDARRDATATLLESGEVLVIGGEGANGTLATIEVFDPAGASGAGVFRSAGAMAEGRSAHRATLLPDGSVLITGGCVTVNPCVATASTERWFSDGGGRTEISASMAETRAGHSSTLLPTGDVLVAGGRDGTVWRASAELYDASADAGRGSFSPTGSLVNERTDHTAVLLGTGEVVLIGGNRRGSPFTSIELYDSAAGGGAGAFRRAAGSAAQTAVGSQAVLLPTGHVLTVGGADALGVAVAEAWVFDPFAPPFANPHRPTAPMAVPRRGATATLLPGATVLVAGGTDASGTALSSSEIFDDGLVGDDAWRPAITSGPDRVAGGASAGLRGMQLTGVSEANGSRPNAAGTNLPIATFLRSDGGILLGGITPWTDTTATWNAPITGLHGPGLLFLVTNGIPSNGRPVVLDPAPDGAPCSGAEECASGACADGVCCDAPCAGVCESCRALVKGGGVDGACEPIQAGIDPENECDDQSSVSCGTNGSCSGDGGCALYPPETVCASASCTSDVLTPEATCFAPGACVASANVPCAPGRCAASRDACTLDCADDADCAASGFCDGRECATKRDSGGACTEDRQCATAICADGVCCNDRCAGQCETCFSEGAEGVCTTVEGPPPPGRLPCSGESPPCAGACDGINGGTCRYPDSTLQCADSECLEGAEQHVFCDGEGGCSVARTTDCAGYACAGGACNDRCGVDADCALGFRCDLAVSECVSRDSPFCDGSTLLVDSTGERTDCTPFACKGSACVAHCALSSDCAGGLVCELETGDCIEPPELVEPGGCGCRSSRRAPPPPAGLLLLVVAATVCARRRNAR